MSITTIHITEDTTELDGYEPPRLIHFFTIEVTHKGIQYDALCSHDEDELKRMITGIRWHAKRDTLNLIMNVSFEEEDWDSRIAEFEYYDELSN
jgi:hypothetical protein